MKGIPIGKYSWPSISLYYMPSQCNFCVSCLLNETKPQCWKQAVLSDITGSYNIDYTVISSNGQNQWGPTVRAVVRRKLFGFRKMCALVCLKQGLNEIRNCACVRQFNYSLWKWSFAQPNWASDIWYCTACTQGFSHIWLANISLMSLILRAQNT